MKSKKNVIVTGGAGFIGSSLCKELSKSNFNPIVIDDLSTGFRQLVKYGDFIESDCGDYLKMIDVFAKYKPIAIFHVAGSKSVSESIANPYKYYENNFTKTNILLKAAVDSNIEHFIFSSSAAIFGQVDTGAKSICENYPTNPINPYGHSKLMAERLLEDYAKAYGLKYSALRYFNVSGADYDCELGEMSDLTTNIFPILFRVASGQQKEFTIFGDDYLTKDGSCVRDYIHVSDLALAHILALKKQIQNKKSVKLNLGNGAGFSVKEVVEVFKKVTECNFEVLLGDKREGDSDFMVADNSFSSEYLNWRPKYQKIEEHILHAWNWHKALGDKN